MILRVFIILCLINVGDTVLLPIKTTNRKVITELTLTQIGAFGIMRKARPQVQQHLHTGIDIMRPNKNYNKEFIYPIADGVIISKRTDGPYAQLIVEHEVNNDTFWTVYEHIAGIQVELYEPVNPQQPIARFFNLKELDKFGWQFDHFHFEVLKIRPISIKPSFDNPERHFNSYTLSCQTTSQLQKHYYNPSRFLSERL